MFFLICDKDFLYLIRYEAKCSAARPASGAEGGRYSCPVTTPTVTSVISASAAGGSKQCVDLNWIQTATAMMNFLTE